MAGAKDAAVQGGAAAKDIVVLGNARELAASWVKSMTGGAEEDSEEEEQQLGPPRLGYRPSRLGLGAKFLPHSLGMRAAAASPVEKKLMAKLNIQSKDTTYGRAFHQQCKKYEKRRDGAEVDSDRQSDEEEMFESRASAFKRKAARQSAKSLLQYDEYKAPGRPKRRKRRKKSSR